MKTSLFLAHPANKFARIILPKTKTYLVLAGAVVLLFGCFSTGQGSGSVDDNVTTFCDHGNRVYVDHTAGALAAVKDDPSCANGNRS